jgi:hypothetical protein
VFRNQLENGGIATERGTSIVQVWTTAQCLKGVLANPKEAQKYRNDLRAAFDYIEKSRRDTLQPGWGYFEPHQWTVTEIAAWVVLASEAGVNSGVVWTPGEVDGLVRNRIVRDLDHILSRQDKESGGWRPISEDHPRFTRTYSTLMALWSLIEAKRTPQISKQIGARYDKAIERGIDNLIRGYDGKQGWVANPNRTPADQVNSGLTAQVLFLLSRAESDFAYLKNDGTYKSAKQSFLQNETWKTLAPNHQQSIPNPNLHFLPTDFVLEGSSFLWHPWALATFSALATDQTLTRKERNSAHEEARLLLARIDDVQKHVDSDNLYVLAENLFCHSYALHALEEFTRRKAR